MTECDQNILGYIRRLQITVHMSVDWQIKGYKFLGTLPDFNQIAEKIEMTSFKLRQFAVI